MTAVGNERAGRRRTLALAAAGATAAAGLGYAAVRAARNRRPAPVLPGELELPGDVRRLDVPVRDGGSIHIVDYGEGPPIVLLHGVTLQAAVWAYQVRDLAPRHRMIAVDLRGHGQSEPGEAGMTIAAMADDLADVLEALDLRQVTLVGHSMGGMAVLRACRRHPNLLADRVGAIALVASAGGIAPPLSGWHRFAPKAAALVVAGHRALGGNGPVLPSSTAGERATRVVFGLRPDPAAVRATFDLARAMAPDRFVALIPELVGFDERAVFEAFPMPCTVVVGDRDRLTPPRYAEALTATLPGSRLVVWPGAGHMLMYERRESLDNLLDELSAAPSLRSKAPS